MPEACPVSMSINHEAGAPPTWTMYACTHPGACQDEVVGTPHPSLIFFQPIDQRINPEALDWEQHSTARKISAKQTPDKFSGHLSVLSRPTCTSTPSGFASQLANLANTPNADPNSGKHNHTLPARHKFAMARGIEANSRGKTVFARATIPKTQVREGNKTQECVDAHPSTTY